jgi:hypothetical protein
MKKVLITINEDGSTQISVQGVKGKSCKDLTKMLEQALGGQGASRDTPEMLQRETLTVRQRGR